MTGCITGWPRLLIKRFIFSRRVTQICKKNGFSISKNGAFWWLGSTKSGKYSFTVYCGSVSYCVKLIGIRSRNILFGFVDKTHYEIKDYTFALPHTTFDFEYVLKKKEPYRFEKSAVPCIVMITESVKVTVRESSTVMRRIEIGSGDKTPEGEFYFARKFINLLNYEKLHDA